MQSKYPYPIITSLTIVVFIALSTIRFVGTSNNYELRNYTASDFSNELTSAQKILIGEKIDINSADEETFQLLYRIGPALAKRIVEDRQKNGPFKSADDLDRVSGIGPKIIQSNRYLIEVR